MDEKTDNREFLKRTTLQDLLNQKNVLTQLSSPTQTEISRLSGKIAILEEKLSKIEEIRLCIFTHWYESTDNYIIFVEYHRHFIVNDKKTFVSKRVRSDFYR